MSASILRSAHGAARAGGAEVVAETPPLDELAPLNPDDTGAALALARRRGRPFQPGNAAAANRGPSLTRIALDPSAPEERRRVHRKAATLKARRERELAVQHGGRPVSSAVKVELVHWARNTAWAEFFDRAGDALRAASLAEKASAHQLKAIGIAEREARAVEATSFVHPYPVWSTPQPPPPETDK